ncbi:TonB-dependent receptor [Sphingomonas mollis]|nr:TonB-dependent receptor [Sphingomonas sp. BT553]
MLAFTAPVHAQNSPHSIASDRQTFNIPVGPLDAALKTWSQVTRRSIIFRSEQVATKRTSGVQGRMSSDDALNILLTRSGFVRMDEPGGAVAIVPEVVQTDGGNATPDILVTGRSSWSLNTGIARTQDDSQPFIVMTREEIQRSGAPNLESFLRDRLNVNASPVVSQQARGGNSNSDRTRGLSSINLRGLGARDTLILVDGRRQPGVNIGTGDLVQPSITGIPIASIERIEVLASSASGIYGSGASGGVINIVLKRDFTGGEISASYRDTTDFAQGEAQLDGTYGIPLEGGRTRLSVTGSWLKTRPLLYGDRASLAKRSIDQIRSNDPSFFEGSGNQVPDGAMTNFKTAYNQGSSFYEPLTLKPEYGGATMPFDYGTIPTGYRGVAVDGVAPLVASIGTYNYDLNNSSTSLGRRSPMLFGSERFNGSVTIRREFNDRLTGYVGATWTRTSSSTLLSRGPETFRLSPDAPDNPFQQELTVALPGVALAGRVRNRQTGLALIGGVIAKLPGDWQAALDFSYTKSHYLADSSEAQVSEATVLGLESGAENALRDLGLRPLALAYDDLPFYSARTPGRSSTFAPSLRIAGPLPLTLPGGKSQMTLNVEFSDDRLGAVVSASNEATRSSLTYAAPVSQRTVSAYGEIALPIISEGDRIPLIRLLELRLSARAEMYRGNGANPYACDTSSSPLPADNPFAGCPPVGGVIERSITRNSHVDPSISFRWSPVKPLILRGSYTTGYLPPTLTQLVKLAGDELRFRLTDPARGNEPIGVSGPFGRVVPGFFGGNPDVRPESSKTVSAGIILTPAFATGLRISADWTRIKKRDVYFNPAFTLQFGDADFFATFLAANPDRVIRAQPSDGYTVGRITSLDASIVNLLGASTEAVDFVLEYDKSLFGGNLTMISRGTFVRSLVVESFPGVPPVDYAGVVPQDFASAGGANGTLRWRGSAAANWTKDSLNLGWQVRYIDRYALNEERSVVAAQGSAYVKSQIYHDINASYQVIPGTTMLVGVNNVFNSRPPLDISSQPLYYSSYADPRLRSFYLRLQKSF